MPKKRKCDKPTIDLRGPDGNAFVLMKIAKKLTKMLGKDENAIFKEMTGSNYDNLVKVFEREFGDYVDLIK